MKLRRALLATSIAVSGTIIAAAPSSVNALDRHPYMEAWPSCTRVNEEYCVESLSIAIDGGATDTYTTEATNSDAGHPYVRFFDQRMDFMPTGMLPMLGYSILDNRYGSTGSGTNDGIAQGEYHLVVRIGDFDPTVFISSGEISDYTITKGPDNYWTIDVTMTPTPFGGPSATQSMAGDCTGRIEGPSGTVAWPSACETAGSATKRELHGGVVTIDQGLDATEARGMWVATNSVGFQFPQFNMQDRSISATVVGPHYLPVGYAEDCAAEGLESGDGGKCLTPAHYSTYVPFKAIAAFLGNGMTVDIVKSYISGDALTAEVEGDPFGGFTVVVDDNGIMVDMNLTHFSKPNPKIKFKAIKTLKAGTLSNRSTFVTVPGGATVTEFKVLKQTPSGVCSTSGASVKATSGKTGYCVISVKYKKAGSTRIIAKKTAIRIIR